MWIPLFLSPALSADQALKVMTVRGEVGSKIVVKDTPRDIILGYDLWPGDRSERVKDLVNYSCYMDY
jgi:hypothetical protein